jgi:hypothetical protein
MAEKNTSVSPSIRRVPGQAIRPEEITEHYFVACVLTFRRGIVGVMREWWQRRSRQVVDPGVDHQKTG